MTKSKPRAPAGLAARGRRFWADTLADFELTDAELHLLHEACRSLDRIDALEDLVKVGGQTTEGSTGQTVLHPAIGEARQQRLVLARLVAQLDLPDEDDASSGSAAVPAASSVVAASDRGRRAAQARWSRTPRKGA